MQQVTYHLERPRPGMQFGGTVLYVDEVAKTIAFINEHSVLRFLFRYMERRQNKQAR
jgi:hypothetical protein